MKQYYKNKPEKYNVHKENYVKNNDSVWFLKAQSMVMERLVHGCMDCGEKNPVVLEFDHRIPSDKKFSISRLMRQKVNENTFIEELNKCDIVCANCHRIRSAKMFGSWRSEII